MGMRVGRWWAGGVSGCLGNFVGGGSYLQSMVELVVGIKVIVPSWTLALHREDETVLLCNVCCICIFSS